MKIRNLLSGNVLVAAALFVNAISVTNIQARNVALQKALRDLVAALPVVNHQPMERELTQEQRRINILRDALNGFEAWNDVQQQEFVNRIRAMQDGFNNEPAAEINQSFWESLLAFFGLVTTKAEVVRAEALRNALNAVLAQIPEASRTDRLDDANLGRQIKVSLDMQQQKLCAILTNWEKLMTWQRYGFVQGVVVDRFRHESFHDYHDRFWSQRVLVMGSVSYAESLRPEIEILVAGEYVEGRYHEELQSLAQTHENELVRKAARSELLCRLDSVREEMQRKKMLLDFKLRTFDLMFFQKQRPYNVGDIQPQRVAFVQNRDNDSLVRMEVRADYISERERLEAYKAQYPSYCYDLMTGEPLYFRDLTLMTECSIGLSYVSGGVSNDQERSLMSKILPSVYRGLSISSDYWKEYLNLMHNWRSASHLARVRRYDAEYSNCVGNGLERWQGVYEQMKGLYSTNVILAINDPSYAALFDSRELEMFCLAIWPELTSCQQEQSKDRIKELQTREDAELMDRLNLQTAEALQQYKEDERQERVKYMRQYEPEMLAQEARLVEIIAAIDRHWFYMRY